ncbi:FitA-like ribbon-helix-helix domain-containing protein [Acidisoma sp. S159]|uniref:FitA-like ribbon-helix-helix domain-containing protein n=1 Tax=Acidisoma sp. S159 TaxID=1747225 RepID=UPI00352AEAF6
MVCHPDWSRIRSVPVNLSIKDAPDQVVLRLRERPQRYHRSLKGELLAIIEAAVEEDRRSSR